MSELVNFSVWYNQKLDALGVSAGEFAATARLSRAASYFYKKGDRVPDRAAILKIAAALKINLADMPKFQPKATKA